MRNITLDGKALVAEYRRQYGNRTVLAFSRGKDSIATALWLIKNGMEIVPVHYDMVPGLPFIEESLAYYERTLFGGRRILRFPHPSCYHFLNSTLYQTAGTAQVIAAANLISPVAQSWYRDINGWACEETGFEEDVLTANGMRARDSPARWMSFRRHGAIRPSACVWCPIWSYTKADVVSAIDRSDISLPIDYVWFGRTFDGLDARFLVPLKRNSPRDWAALLEWYPLAEMEVWKYERFVEGKAPTPATRHQTPAIDMDQAITGSPRKRQAKQVA